MRPIRIKMEANGISKLVSKRFVLIQFPIGYLGILILWLEGNRRYAAAKMAKINQAIKIALASIAWMILKPSVVAVTKRPHRRVAAKNAARQSWKYWFLISARKRRRKQNIGSNESITVDYNRRPHSMPLS